MGNLVLRRIIKRDTEWIEKGIERHKHEYTMNYLLKEIAPSGKVKYYNIMKCNKCKSFKSIGEKENVSGVILRELNDKEMVMPKLIGKKKHEYLMGFYDLESVKYEE